MYIERTESGWYRGRMSGGWEYVYSVSHMDVIKMLILKLKWMRK